MHSGPRCTVIFRPLLALLCLCLAVPILRAQSTSRTVTAVLTASPEPSAYESNLDIILEISTPSGGAAPGGTVAFSIDGAPLGSKNVQNNMAELFLTAPDFNTGTHTVTAVYSGDANYDPVTESIQHDITKLPSQMNLTVTTPLIYYGQTVDALGSVGTTQSPPGATLDGGTITFLLDGNDICDLQVTGMQETCPAASGQGVHSGMHVLVAVYSGNQYYASSRSAEGDFTVLPDDTETLLSTSLTPSIYGQSVTFNVSVTAPYATPVGSVAFYDGVTPLGVGNINASGGASISVSTLTVGTHTITATYAATQDFNASKSKSIQQVVVLPPTAPVGTATLLTSSVNPSVLGQSVIFTASVATTGAFVQIPTGTVTFRDGTSVLGTATIDSTGSAQFTTAALALGQHPITASYAGTTSFAASVSATLVQTVVASLTSAGNGFLLTITPTSIDVGVGSSVSVSVNVLPLNGFNQPVTLSCLSAPSEMRCLFDSVTIPAGGGTTRLTVNPAAPHDCGSDTPYFITNSKAGLLPLLTGLSALLFGRRRRRWLHSLALGCCLAVLPLLGGCGHCTDLGVKPGNYTFVVQGVSTGSAAVTHSVGMKLNVHL